MDGLIRSPKLSPGYPVNWCPTTNNSPFELGSSAVDRRTALAMLQTEANYWLKKGRLCELEGLRKKRLYVDHSRNRYFTEDSSRVNRHKSPKL
jgi:hypothetical protein